MRRIALLFALAACSDLTAPDNAVPIYPIPQEYRLWWVELESCSGFSGDIDAVRFYTIPYTPNRPGGRAEWQDSRSTIQIVEHVRGVKWRVQHEMMHVLGRFSTHPAQYFNGACGNLMTDR